MWFSFIAKEEIVLLYEYNQIEIDEENLHVGFETESLPNETLYSLKNTTVVEVLGNRLCIIYWFTQ